MLRSFTRIAFRLSGVRRQIANAIRLSPFTISATTLAMFSVPAARADDVAWRYAVPQDTTFAPAGQRILKLEGVIPAGVTSNVQPQGELKYTQIRYGSADSDRVAVMIDEHFRGFDLYVDSNRDRHISEHDKISGSGAARELQLSTQVVLPRGKVHEPRQVSLQFRQGRLLWQTLGYIEGRLDLGATEYPVRRIDMNGNGLFADLVDRIWIDLNEDHRWHAFSEQFAYRPVMRLAGQRYALASDLLGRSLSARRIDGLGQLRLELADRGMAERISDLSVILESRDGTIVHLEQLGTPTEVPVGEYRLPLPSINPRRVN